MRLRGLRAKTRNAAVFSGRRAFLTTLVAFGAMAFARPETLLMRRAELEEVGDYITLTARFPELLRKRDREAMASIDSGFATTLVYDVSVWERGTNRLVTRERRVVELVYEPYHHKYEVTIDDGRGRKTRRWFDRRDEAVEQAIRLQRMRIARSNSLRRVAREPPGPGDPYYYATVVGQRNPIASGVGPTGLDDPAAGRAQGRDVRWFSRFVKFLASDLPEAEDTIQYRTQSFFLLPRGGT